MVFKKKNNKKNYIIYNVFPVFAKKEKYLPT